MRDVYLGIDLGTSSAKAVLVDRQGIVLGSTQHPYGVSRPAAEWAEQDPEAWWGAVTSAVAAVLRPGIFRVISVGLAGQMHGLVMIDADDVPVRDAIIWSDARSRRQQLAWTDRIGSTIVEHTTGFPIATGFLGVSLSWVREEEPENYARAARVLLPKDYVRLRLTGEVATEPTDAAGSLLYDIHRGVPAHEILRANEFDEDLFPSVVPSLATAGWITAEAARVTGIPLGTPVAAGGSDQTMGALVLGLDDPTRVAVAVSSGGTVFKQTATPLNSETGLHVMPHATPGTWLAMGVVLSAGLGLDWLTDRVFGAQRSPETISTLMAEADRIPVGANGLVFSAALSGTRTPRVDASARGSLLGLGFEHGQAHIARAMIEGVCIGLDASVRSMAAAGEPISEIVISGGGARFRAWRQTLSDVSGLPVVVSTDIEHSALGAASAGAEAIGHRLEADFSLRIGDTVEPDPESTAAYDALRHEIGSLERVLATRKEEHR